MVCLSSASPRVSDDSFSSKNYSGHSGTPKPSQTLVEWPSFVTSLAKHRNKQADQNLFLCWTIFPPSAKGDAGGSYQSQAMAHRALKEAFTTDSTSPGQISSKARNR